MKKDPDTDKIVCTVICKEVIGYCGTEGCGAEFYDAYVITVVDGEVVSCEVIYY